MVEATDVPLTSYGTKLVKRKVRRRLKEQTGTLMHQGQGPRKELLCCLQSSGLCRNIGGKHHRRNKKCWSHSVVCTHCVSARMAATEISDNDDKPSGRPKYDFVPHQPPAVNATSGETYRVSNETTVEVNNMITVIHKPMYTHLPDQLLPRTLVKSKEADAVSDLTEPELQTLDSTERIERTNMYCNALKRRGSVIPLPMNHVETRGNKSGTFLSADTAMETVEAPQFASHLHADECLKWSCRPSLIRELEQREVRSGAPSPESLSGRHLEHQPRRVLLEASEVTLLSGSLRDPRLDVKFMLHAR